MINLIFIIGLIKVHSNNMSVNVSIFVKTSLIEQIHQNNPGECVSAWTVIMYMRSY